MDHGHTEDKGAMLFLRKAEARRHGPCRHWWAGLSGDAVDLWLQERWGQLSHDSGGCQDPQQLYTCSLEETQIHTLAE